MKRNWARIFRQLMPFLDVILVILSFWAAHYLRYNLQILRPVEEVNYSPFEMFLPYALFFALWLSVTWPVAALYREQRGRSWIEEVYSIANGATNATVIIMALSFLLQPAGFSRLLILIAAVLVILVLSIERILYRMLRRILRRHGIGVERVLLVGAGNVGRAVLSSILARPDLGYVSVGYLDDNPERGGVDMGRVRGLGGSDNLPTLLKNREADFVIVALPWDARDKIMEVVAICDRYRVQVRVVPDLFQLNMSQVRIEKLEGIPLLGLRSEPRLTRSGYFAKRVIDIGILLASLPFALSLGLLLTLAIKLDSPGPIFYIHRRVGKDGREFGMIKFRTMYKDADKRHDELIRSTGADPKRPKWVNDPRVTRVGRWIRRTSMDELPNLINVFRGEMSIVGPRPPTPTEVQYYEPWQRQRLNTQPGMTGLSQVSGRSNIPFEEQCLLDIYYIENWSLSLELQILLRSVPSILLGAGAY